MNRRYIIEATRRFQRKGIVLFKSSEFSMNNFKIQLVVEHLHSDVEYGAEACMQTIPRENVQSAQYPSYQHATLLAPGLSILPLHTSHVITLKFCHNLLYCNYAQ